MNTTLTALLLLLLALLVWQTIMKIHDLAVAAARNTCAQRNVQFLDGTAVISNTRLGFSIASGPCLRRTYTFDYSEDGIIRLTGCVIMCNAQVESVVLSD